MIEARYHHTGNIEYRWSSAGSWLCITKQDLRDKLESLDPGQAALGMAIQKALENR